MITLVGLGPIDRVGSIERMTPPSTALDHEFGDHSGAAPPLAPR